MSLVRSVSVGTARPAEWASIRRSAIEKHPVTGPVRVRRLGLDGDQVGDPRHHGGADQAVYAYAREDLDFWERELGLPIRDGGFGENLTTQGVDVNDAEVGERWRIGTTLLEVRSIRIPCRTFKGWQDRNGYDATAWVRRFTEAGRCGPYLRVVTEGELGAGDAIDVVHQPGHGVTVAMMFRALTTEPDLLPDLLRVDGLVSRARERAERYVAAS